MLLWDLVLRWDRKKPLFWQSRFLKRFTPLLHIAFDNGNNVEIAPYEWKKYRFETEYDRSSGRDVVKQVEIGSFRQLPLRSGYAATIHKAQGQTFDEMTVDVGSGCFASGQLYTALSRCRSLQSLHLTRPISREDVIVSPEVLNFYRHLVA